MIDYQLLKASVKMVRNHDKYFSQNIFYLDQFGYTKQASAFCTQIGLTKKIRTNLGTLSTGVFLFWQICRILVQYAQAWLVYSNEYTTHRLSSLSIDDS